MKHTDAFSRCHPLVSFLYFVLVLVVTMISMHPVMLALSLAAGMWYACTLQGKKTLRFFLQIVIPVALLAALCNMAFTHKGVTMLFYLPTGNTVTLESILYGLAAGVMLGAVLLWFRCCTEILTTDKLLYLFGRIIPGLALLLSMILRFVPEFARQLKKIRQARRGLRQETGKTGESVRARIHSGLSEFSILVTWALEHAVETADSMKSRGFGLPGRSAFSIYRFTRRDAVLLGCEGLLGGGVIAGLITGVFTFDYYPVCTGLSAETCGPLQLAGFLVYTALLLLPLILDRREEKLWQTSKYRT